MRVFSSSAEFLERQRKLAEQMMREEDEIEQIDLYNSEIYHTEEMISNSDSYYNAEDSIERSYEEYMTSSSDMLSSESDIPSSSGSVSSEVDEKENPIKRIQGFYDDPIGFNNNQPEGIDFNTIDFMKDIILRYMCYQVGYIVEDGEVYTYQEMSEFLKNQEEEELKQLEADGEDTTERRELQQNSTIDLFPSSLPLGPDCEALICGSCKAVMEEFGKSLQRASRDVYIKHMREVERGFCHTKDIAMKYLPITQHICQKMFDHMPDYMMSMFEKVDWSTDYLPDMYNRKKQVCGGAGFCTEKSFQFQQTPQHFKQNHWNANCYVCRHMAADIEERVVLTRTVTEGLAEVIVQEVCDKVMLPAYLEPVCVQILEKKKIDMAWIAKLHAETIWKRQTAPENMFPERLCTEVGYCAKYVDPVEVAKKEIELEAEYW